MAGLIGYPARYSLSPVLHNAAYVAMGEDMVYVAFPVGPDHLGAAIAAVRAFDIVGLSVTIPHKEAVVRHLDDLAPAARLVNAANTVVNRNGNLEGHNTDGAGFVRALSNEAAFEVAGTRCVVVGAGGAARAVIVALADAGAADIAVVNRTANRARDAAILASVARVGTTADLTNANLVVNATPIGLGDVSSESPIDAAGLHSDQLVADLIYHPLETKLLADAQACGARTINGLAMLVYQAAIQIELWTGRTPPIDVMFKATE